MENRTTVLSDRPAAPISAQAEIDTSRLVKVLFLGRRFHAAPGQSIAQVCSAAGVEVTEQHMVRLNASIIPSGQAGTTVTSPGDFLVVVQNLKNG